MNKKKPNVLETEVNKNSKTLNIETSQIKSIEDLIKQCGINLEEWLIKDHVISKWDTSAKINGKLEITPMFKVKVDLVRKKPLELETPVIKPIQIKSIKWKDLPKRMSTAIKTAMIIPDMHVGFKREGSKLVTLHDRRAINVAQQIANDVDYDELIFLGDNLDLADWSKFLTSPEYVGYTQSAIVELGVNYAQFGAAKRSRKRVWIAGNHCARLEKLLIQHAQQIYGLRPFNDLEGYPLFSVQRLLDIDSLEMEYRGPYPTGEYWLGQDFRLHHGDVVRSGSGATVSKVVQDLRHHEGFGHLHRQELAAKTFWHGEEYYTYYAVSFGTLANLKPHVIPAANGRNNWQTGVGVVHYLADHPHVNINLIQIQEGAAIYNAKPYIGESEEAIRKTIIEASGYDEL